MKPLTQRDDRAVRDRSGTPRSRHVVI